MAITEFPHVYFLSLGCFKNTVDSEAMLWDLRNEGFELSENPEDAGIIVVNTCSFIDPAKEESIDAILEASSLKKGGRAEVIVVVGCLVERFRKQLEISIPEVDVFLDLEEEKEIGKALKQKLGLVYEKRAVEPETGRIPLTPPHLSFLKIAEGCSRHCTFCTIPSIRGQFRSKTIDGLIREAQYLESRGVRELNVISQDTVSYSDPSGQGLVDLLRRLLSHTAIPWIRLLYLNPAGFGDDLIELVACEERLVSYVDLPIQHISNPILKRMGRDITRKGIETLISDLRERVAGVTLRTTVLVGFPGEEEKHFRELLDFIEDIEFDRLGAFVYSREEGTPSSKLTGQVSEEIKQERYFQVMELQRTISNSKCLKRKGMCAKVIVDSVLGPGDLDVEKKSIPVWGERIQCVGRSRREAYEVDGVIYLAGDYEVGEFTNVRIVEAMDYDLVAWRE